MVQMVFQAQQDYEAIQVLKGQMDPWDLKDCQDSQDQSELLVQQATRGQVELQALPEGLELTVCLVKIIPLVLYIQCLNACSHNLLCKII